MAHIHCNRCDYISERKKSVVKHKFSVLPKFMTGCSSDSVFYIVASCIPSD